MGRATAAAAVVTLVACLGSSTITSASAFVVMPFSPRLIMPPSSLSMRPAASERSACISRPANKIVGALQAGAGSDNDNNGGNKDDLYYQRFMGMNEGEPTDDLRVAAEIADMDPSTIDSLRRSISVDGKVNMSPSSSSSSSSSSNPFYIGGNSGGSSGSISSGIGSGAGGFLDSMKKKSAASFSTLGGGAGGGGGGMGGGEGMNSNLQKGSPDLMMSGPKVYIIPQNQGEAPLEIKSLAPGQRRSQKGVIAEIPGRSFPKRPRRVDLSEKMAEAKRAIQEAPTRLTELQVQNIRNGAAMNPNFNNPNGQNNNNQNNNNNVNNNSNGQQQQQQNQFTFPSFPSQQPVQQQPKSSPPSSGRSRSKRRGYSSGREQQGSRSRMMNSRRASPASEFKFPPLPAWSKDWRVWVGGIAAVSFFTALVNSLSYRSELMVMHESERWEGGRDAFMLERKLGQQQPCVGDAVERMVA